VEHQCASEGLSLLDGLGGLQGLLRGNAAFWSGIRGLVTFRLQGNGVGRRAGVGFLALRVCRGASGSGGVLKEWKGRYRA
jgi:hypothetical protein